MFQNVLRELEQKKPQLDELVKTAENLRESPIKQQIPDKGKKMQFTEAGKGFVAFNVYGSLGKFIQGHFSRLIGRTKQQEETPNPLYCIFDSASEVSVCKNLQIY